MRVRACTVGWVAAVWFLSAAAAAAAGGWSILPTPIPSGAASSNFSGGISCSSERACTAVGYFQTAAGDDQTLAERWDGRSWQIQATPNPSGASYNFLYGVSCPKRKSCMAVGTQQPKSGIGNTLAERWDGDRWQITPAPSRPDDDLASVSCPTTRVCLAVGGARAFGGTMLAERWDGSIWSVQATPKPPGSIYSFFVSVSCAGPDACTAVGGYFTNDGRQHTLIERWDGRAWQIQPSPEPPGASDSELLGVSCPTERACTAVGFGSTLSTHVDSTLAEHWNGSHWEIQPTPGYPGIPSAELGSVSCPTRRTCTATGTYMTTPNSFHSFAERWHKDRWEVQSMVAFPPSVVSGLSVSCPEPSLCMAAGAEYVLPAIPTEIAPTYLLTERYTTEP